MKGIKSFFKSIAVAFSMYSKIPMPRFEWATDDMKYHLIFFPWIGAVIGALEVVLFWLYQLMVNDCFGRMQDVVEAAKLYGGLRMAYVVFAMAIPLLVTGGFHVDGFMDTMDALHSYQDREKKLEILKDPHIGAFSVICLACYGLIYAGFLALLDDMWAAVLYGVSFFMARALSGIGVMVLKSAKSKGMLSTESGTAEKKPVIISLVVELAIAVTIIVLLSWWRGVILIAVEAAVFFYYKWKSEKEFGGITGDLAGFFVCISEISMLGAISIMSLF